MRDGARPRGREIDGCESMLRTLCEMTCGGWEREAEKEQRSEREGEQREAHGDCYVNEVTFT